MAIMRRIEITRPGTRGDRKRLPPAAPSLYLFIDLLVLAPPISLWEGQDLLPVYGIQDGPYPFPFQSAGMTPFQVLFQWI